MQAPVTKSDTEITIPPITDKQLIALILIWLGNS